MRTTTVLLDAGGVIVDEKPDPRYYEQIVRACGVHPQQCIMVGDRIDKDVVPAKQLGMKTILIRVGLHRNQQPRIPFEVPDAELDGVPGLAAVVRKVARRPEGTIASRRRR